MRIRDLADTVGITERAVQRIVAELEQAGALTKIKEGRRNHYEVNTHLPLRHPVEAHCRIGDILKMVVPKTETPSQMTEASASN